MATCWVTELDKKEHKNWVMVGCALNIAKNGITQLIQGRMEAWYQSLISKPHLQSLAPCTSTCTPGSLCRTCLVWKAELKSHHKFNQPKISNSDRTQWGSPAGAWEIAKVFMSALGSRKTQVVDAETTDISGLLNLLEQCPFIQPPVNPTVLSSARDQCRNHWAHAPKQELQDTDVNTIFGHLNNLLNDPVFNADNASRKSSKHLQDLRNNGLLNVRESEVEALYLLRQSLVADLTKCRDDLGDVQKKVVQLDEETGKAVEKVKEQSDLNREEIAKQGRQLDTKIREVEASFSEKASTILRITDEFNKLVNERDDLRVKCDLICNDLEDVQNCMWSVDMELTATKSKLANLDIKVSNTISSLQKDVTEIKEEVETLKINASHRENGEDSDTLFTAPSRLTAFSGRKSALQWLEQNLDPDQSSKNGPGTSCCTKAICGLGGCGKTSLAVEFSWRCSKRFPGGVFWINGENDENISKSVVESLALLNIPASTSEKVDDILNRFLANLSKKNSPWLLVMDNADELEDQTCPSGVKKICKGPWQRNGKAFKYGHILLTTRRSAKDTRTFLKLSSDDCFELQCFSEEEGALFLMQRTGFKVEAFEPDAILLAKELGSLPLALEQAAAYISALPRPCSFKAYLEKYRAVKLRLLKQQPATALSVEGQHRLSVHTTWEMNFKFVSEKSPAAATMLRIAAFLESENIPVDVINPGFPELNQEELRESVRSEIDVEAILKILSSYSLISVDQKRRVFSVHKLVQEVVKESLTTVARIEMFVAASRVLHFAFKANNEQDTPTGLLLSFRTLKNHMEEESNLLKEDSLHVLYNTEILELCSFVCELHADGEISLFSVFAELSEFKLRVLRTVYDDADKPDLLLSTMVDSSFFKQSFSALEGKKLSDNAVNKLTEFEESGVKVDVNIKFDVLFHSTSFYLEEDQWEKYYMALLKLEELPISIGRFINLQHEIARAEDSLSPCNYHSALRRCQETLKIARVNFPSCDHPTLGVLQRICDLLRKAGKLQEANLYADEMWEICKKLPPTSFQYIVGVSTAMRVKCYFDPQSSEDILVDILKRNWPHVYRIAASLRQRQVNVEEINVDGDTFKRALVEVLSGILECLLGISLKTAMEQTKLNFFKMIAEIKLCVKKNLFGEIHPALEEAYGMLKNVHVMLGNEKEVVRLQELVVKCKQLVSDHYRSVYKTLQAEVNLVHRNYKDSADFFFRKGNYLSALTFYTQALSLSPNDAKLLSNTVAASVRLSEQSSVERKQKFLEEALQYSQKAIAADPSWVKGYYWKAVCLAHLGKRGPSLAAAAVAKHLFPSQCARIPAVVDHFGSCDTHVVTTVQELLHSIERRGTQNLVILVKEGRFELPTPFNLSSNTVMVGLGSVQITCSKGVPLTLDKTVYIENITLSPTMESITRLKEKAKACLNNGQVNAALSLYSEGLILCPNNPQILTSRASTYLKSAERKKEIPSEHKLLRELALNDAEAAIKADPTWLLGYYTKAASLAELGRKHEALAAAAVFKHLSSGRDVPGVAQSYGDLQILVVQSSVELSSVPEEIKKFEGVNEIVLIKEGEYLLEKSVEIPQPIIFVGQGKVKVSCKVGPPFHLTQAGCVENVEIVENCDNQQETRDCASNDTQSEIISLATPSEYEHNNNECKVN